MAKKDDSLVPMRELTKMTGFSRATINYYIREGLLPAPQKSAKNMAYYDADFVRRLKIIKQLKSYHFSLKHIRHSLNCLYNREDSVQRTHFRALLYKNVADHAEERQSVSLDTIQDATGLSQEILQQLIDLNLIYLVNAEKQYYDGSAIRLGNMIREQMEMGISIDSILLVVKRLFDLSVLELRAFSHQIRMPMMEQQADLAQQADAVERFLTASNALVLALHQHFLQMPLEKMSLLDAILEDIEQSAD